MWAVIHAEPVPDHEPRLVEAAVVVVRPAVAPLYIRARPAREPAPVAGVGAPTDLRLWFNLTSRSPVAEIAAHADGLTCVTRTLEPLEAADRLIE